MPDRLPDRPNAAFTLGGGAGTATFPDASFEGVAWRRCIAFVIDIMILASLFLLLWIFNVFVFFLLSGLLTFLWPALLFVLYDTVLIGGRSSATIGMRIMGLKMVSWQGDPPGYLQAVVLSVLFYLSVTVTSGLVLIVALFNDRSRCLHDILAGVFVVHSEAGTTGPPAQ